MEGADAAGPADAGEDGQDPSRSPSRPAGGMERPFDSNHMALYTHSATPAVSCPTLASTCCGSEHFANACIRIGLNYQATIPAFQQGRTRSAEGAERGDVRIAAPRAAETTTEAREEAEARAKAEMEAESSPAVAAVAGGSGGRCARSTLWTPCL